MLQKLMDFNPLDILAAAALGEKDASSDLNSTSCGQEGPSGSNNTSGESEESKDAEDESEADMGKTTSNGLKSGKGVKEAEKTMAPQKSPWSPDAFLSPNLGSPPVLSDKFCIGDLVQDLKKSPECEKLIHSSILSDPLGDPLGTTNEFDPLCNGFNNNVVSVKNVSNKLATDAVSDASTPKSPLLGDPPSVKSVDTDCPARDADAPTDKSEQGSPSDTDTADSDSKLSELMEMAPSESVGLDHPYALIPGQPGPSSVMDPFEEDDVDVCSQSSPLTEETEQRSRNLSLDCNYLKSGILEGVSASTLDLYKMSSCALGRSKLPSSSSSTSSPTHDLSCKPGLTNLSKDEPCDAQSRACTPSNDNNVLSPDKRSPKFGKFKIGTFASFSSSNLELEKYLRSKDHVNGRKLNIGIPSDTSLISSSLSSPTSYPSLHPLLQSPSLDWDRSEAGSEAHDDSSDARTPHRLSPDFTTEKVTEWSHPMYHDHDYCAKDSDSKTLVEDTSKSNSVKRKYTKRKSKLDSVVNHEKIMKAKYLKKELLKQDTFKKATPSDVEFMPVEAQSVKSNPVGRPKKRPFEKTEEEEIDPETGAKMKITGKFQDQYVYYLSKSSRTTSRRRQTPALPFPSDKIIVPAPKPGDIIVPHLTDDDIEAVRLRGRAALNPPDRPQMSCNIVSPAVPSSTSSELISDVDSHIVSTILSMENDIGSPVTSQPSDISNTSDLNPNQPALTESLRIMSGDNSITSEHVLNYLLSVVKDEVPGDNLLSSTTTGFDTSSSTLFSPLSSDSIYSKVDHLEPPDLNHPGVSAGGHGTLSDTCSEMLKDDSRALHETNTSSSSIQPCHSQEPVHFAHSLPKDQEEDNVHLPDDLSSFISNSQGTASSSTTHDGDSHGSLKSMFGSDLSSLGTPQLSSSVPRLTSIEKTLDYLGVNNEDIRLDNAEVFSSKLPLDVNSSQPISSEANFSSDDTPWIVTVTLYFNDVPAIMINNQPYIRLVDIHKQILPAKDTGILKKRCQLLKIPVLNCSEMQRYFIVQYGRAYNSKSTLVISKDQATELVTYYANPQPRIGRGEEAHNFRSRSRGSDSGGTLSPVTVVGSATTKKKGHNKGGKKSSTAQGILVSDAADVLSLELPRKAAASEPGTGNGLHSKRTRHKKINYLEMLRGEEKEKTSEDAVMETIESVVKSAPAYCEQQKSKKKSVSTSGVPTKKKLKANNHCDKKMKKVKSGKISKFSMKKLSQGPVINKEKLELTIEKVKSNKLKISKMDRPTEKSCDITPLEFDSDESGDLANAKSKFRPLKLKVNSLLNFPGNKKGSSPTKKGLFSRSNSSSSSSSDRPLRVLAVAHQPALSSEKEESHLPSQPADIHLDLFTRSSSPCVRCQTCSQFLSVPDFMRHHHVAMDNEWLATEAAHRILVPRNKENISEQEKRLWEEFHRLQEAIGGFGEADDESDSDENEDYVDDEEDQCPLNVSGTSSLLSMDRSLNSPGSSEQAHISHHVQSLSSDGEDEDGTTPSSHPSPLSIQPFDERARKLKLEMASKIGLVKRNLCKDTGSSSTASLNGITKSAVISNLRTSSRKRKSKQLFSIENYYTPKKIANGEELQSGNQNSTLDGLVSPEAQSGLGSRNSRVNL